MVFSTSIRLVASGLALVAAALVFAATPGSGNAKQAGVLHAHSALIAAENAKPGTPAWAITFPNDRGVEGYTSEPSVRPGETLHLHVATVPANRYRINVYRLGWYGGAGGRLVTCIPGCAGDEQGVEQPIPTYDPQTAYLNAAWPVTDELRIGARWVSGYYLAEPVLTTGSQTTRGDMIPFIVREPVARRSAILVTASVNTWQAYNWWGGKSLYSPERGVTANHVSFDRPYARFAFNQGHMYQWEIPMVHFLEREGYDVSYTTDVDVDRDALAGLVRNRLVLVNGHSEYWTKEMRDGFEAAARAGTNFAFTGANDGYWQIRYEQERRTIVEYRLAGIDPETDPAHKTTWFRKLDPP
ncbi:MAG: hypothetical protein QOH73_2014, partial [Gaiellaceae bacterium]|nr:hypothetical protein [Gaiellaceae bacterium]